MNEAKTFFRALLAGDAPALERWLDDARAIRAAMLCLCAVLFGGACYGAVIGAWRGEWQTVFTAAKLPLLVLLTCTGNAVLNACLASLLGSRLGFRQTLLALLMSFAVTALLLAACAPICAFLLANAPPLEDRRALAGHGAVLLTHVAVIAWAGVVGNRTLFRLLVRLDGRAVARRVLAAWLAGNLLLGSQCAWILRPFVGTPGLPVEFLREHPLRGSFFEAVAAAARNSIFHESRQSHDDTIRTRR
jgi:hypothetical protein